MSGERAGEWVSLIDVARTVAGFVDRESFGDPSARSLLVADAPDADRPVYAMTDGIPAGEIPHVRAEWRAFLDRLEIAVYGRGGKAVASEDGSARAFQVAMPDRGTAPSALSSGEASDRLTQLARDAMQLATARISAQPYHGTTERRIAGWGY